MPPSSVVVLCCVVCAYHTVGMRMVAPCFVLLCFVLLFWWTMHSHDHPSLAAFLYCRCCALGSDVANVCGNAVADCLPASFTQPPTNGVAVQFFGSVPSCSKPTCTNPSTGTPECCTAECHVLGTGAPTWSFTDASNPSTGGLEATFTPVKVDIDNDPFWCPAESNGSMEPRSVTYHFLCDPSKTPGVISGVEAPKMDNYCTVHVNFTTSLACASS